MIRRPRISTLFPYTPLFRSKTIRRKARSARAHPQARRDQTAPVPPTSAMADSDMLEWAAKNISESAIAEDRKSTRLNSSHANISHAVFCLQIKTEQHADH